MQFLLRNEPHLPYILGDYAHEYRLIELPLVAGKSFEEVLDRGIYQLDAGCLFQELVRQIDQAADDKGRGDISYKKGNADEYDESQTGDPPRNAELIRSDPLGN